MPHAPPPKKQNKYNDKKIRRSKYPHCVESLAVSVSFGVAGTVLAMEASSLRQMGSARCPPNVLGKTLGGLSRSMAPQACGRKIAANAVDVGAAGSCGKDSPSRSESESTAMISPVAGVVPPVAGVAGGSACGWGGSATGAGKGVLAFAAASGAGGQGQEGVLAVGSGGTLRVRPPVAAAYTSQKFESGSGSETSERSALHSRRSHRREAASMRARALALPWIEPNRCTRLN